MTTIRASGFDVGGTDVPGNATTTANLSLGGSLQGSVDTADDNDWYQVSLTAGQTYYFTLTGSGASALGDPHLTLYGLNFANVLAPLFSANDDGLLTHAFLSYTPTQSGTFFVAASGYAWSQGQYTLSAGVMPTDTILATTATTAQLTVNHASAGMATGADSDWYAVQLTAGVAYEVNLSGTVSGAIAGMDAGAIHVMSSDGNQWLASASYSPYPTPYSYYTDSAHTYFTPTQTGTYYIDVDAIQSNSQQQTNHVDGGSYTVNVTTVDDIDANGSVALAIGSSVSSVIGSSTDTDTFKVNLVAGQTYIFHMDPSGDQPIQGSNLSIGGHTTSGAIYNNTTPEITFTAPTTGSYDLVVGGSSGSYTLTTENTGTDVPGNAATTATLAMGATVNGLFDSGTDSDWYQVNLTAGYSYNFDLAPRFQPYPAGTINVVSADGTVLAAGVDMQYNNKYDVNYTPTVSGIYYLAASAFQGSLANNYRVTAAVTSDGHGNTAATAQAVALGQITTGQIDYSGDKDWYTVNAVSGVTYAIDVYATGSDRAEGPQIQIPGAGSSLHIDSAGHVLCTATADGAFSFLVTGGDTGTYSLRTTLIDDLSGNVDTKAFLPIGQSLSSTIDYGGDWLGYNPDTDMIAVQLQAGQSYDFTVVGSGPTPTSPTLNVLNAYGDNIYGRSLIPVSSGHMEFLAQQSGTYYLSVGGFGIGGYTVTANATTDVFDSTYSRTVLTPGTPVHSAIDTATDQDFFQVTFTAGQDYLVTVTQDGSTPINAPQVTVIGTDNNPLSYPATTGAAAHSAELRYTATTSGTAYIDVAGVNGSTGGYTVSVTPVAKQNPATTIDSGRSVANGAISVYFATSGQAYGGHTAAQNWTSTQIAAFLDAADQWSKVANVSFTQVNSAAAAGLIVVLDASTTSVTSIAASGSTPEVAVFSKTAVTTSIAAGSAAYENVLTATGHVLGLTSPDSWSPTHEPLEGVTGPGNPGGAGLNVDWYTVMASGAQPSQPYPIISGLAQGPMGLDVAAIQAKYGTVTHNADNTTYTLPTAAAHAGFSTIWDTGGTDTITFGDTANAVVIDLRPASLAETTGGGGYLSYSWGVSGGYSIAAGVVIENATGGSGNDSLTGNDAANVLTGNDGNDTLIGGLGNDTLIGGAGLDTVDFSGAATGIRVDLTQTTAQDTHQGVKTISGVENVIGSAFDDVIKLGSGVVSAAGNGGTDTLIISGNFASYTVGEQYPGIFTLTDTAGDTITANGISVFQFADKTIDANHLIDIAPYITGDLSAFIAENGNYTLTTDDLNFVDPGDAVITYTASNLSNGTVMVNGTAATTFTSAQVAAGQVVFHESGATGLYASFTASASDGILSDGGGRGMQLQIIRSPGKLINDGDVSHTLTGTSGDDALFGNGGDDTILPGGGTDYVDGGSGNNTVSYANTHAVQVDLVYGVSGSAGVDTLVNIQNLTGSNYSDTLLGNDFVNIIDGGGGADTMQGRGGNDIYYVDNSGDIIIENAHEGVDNVIASVSYALSANVENLTLAGAANLNATGNNLYNTLTGNTGNNILDGGAGPDLLSGGLGNDLLIGGTGADTLDGGDGIDTTSYASAAAGVTASLANPALNTGDAAGDSYISIENLTGTAFADLLKGDGGNNYIYGGDGNDTLFGGTGSDRIDGGAGTNIAGFDFTSANAKVYAFNGQVWVYDITTGDLDTLTNISSLQFSDKTVAVSVAQAFDPYEYMASNPDLLLAFAGDTTKAMAHYLQSGIAEHRPTGTFDVMEYMASNTDLLKLYANDPVSAEQHYVLYGYAEHRPTTSFDALEYIVSNPDLIKAFGGNTTAGEAHYVQHGYTEHRQTTTFDAMEYLASNTDLIRVYGGNATAAEQHYAMFGYNEHRATTSFDAMEYLASNPDLIRAYAGNTNAAEQHYVLYGYGEHRPTTSFDALEYIASNPDLIRAFGANTAAAEAHYVLHGYGEHRQTTTFNAVQYLANYHDLAVAYGNDYHAAEMHYILYGYAEGRTDHHP